MRTRHTVIVAACLLLSAASFAPEKKGKSLLAEAPRSNKKTNKLLQMYRLYYLPFSLHFREGANPNEIVPFVNADPKGITKRLLRAPELAQLNEQWDALREPYKKRSLFLNTQVGLNQSVRISRALVSHSVSTTRRALDGVSIEDRIRINDMLKSKPAEVQNLFKQLRFLKSFLGQQDETQFNFFIVSANWCQSCLEYRVLLETYFKQFPTPQVTLHSIVVQDPKEEIFDAPILKDLFPNPHLYSHESIPRFLSFETPEGKPTILEEGDALRTLFTRYLEKHRGFLDPKTTLFGGPNAARAIASPPEKK